MASTVDGRVRKGSSKKVRTGRTRARRDLSDQERQRLIDNAVSRPRGPDGRFLPNQHRKECTVCMESKWSVDFPNARISDTCAHNTSVCLKCIQESIKADFYTKQWTEISCPECAVRLDFGAMKEYADAATFARYDNLLLQIALREIPGFTWCPLEGCTHGQVNIPDATCPKDPVSVVCQGCNTMYCSQHNVAWHHDVTCAEFDIVVEGPTKAEDLAEYERLKAKTDLGKEMYRREEDRNQAELSEKMIMETLKTRTCPEPSCGWQIEKEGGCDRMLCSKCATQFCWNCGVIFPDDYSTTNRARDEYHHCSSLTLPS